MGKHLYIAEKPSVAREFAAVLGVKGSSSNGYMESDSSIVTWCVGHLVTMSYPEAYDEGLKKWSLDTLPFLPEDFKYEIIDSGKKQYKIVASLLRRSDVDRIYVCTDSGREGEYIYRLVDRMAGVDIKDKRRVWIDSQTQDEIKRGIREAKPLSDYDNLARSAYLRAQEDYLMGINFSRLLTLKYGNSLASYLRQRYAVVSVGRVMTCVLGMVVRREREIRGFTKTSFFRVIASLSAGNDEGGAVIEAEWKLTPDSVAWEKPVLYKDTGFLKKEDAQKFIAYLRKADPQEAAVEKKEKKTEKKNAPLLYNLAELQNECSKLLKLSPDQTLSLVQELYERKLVTYPRTDARVLSSAVAKEIEKNLKGLTGLELFGDIAKRILSEGTYKKISSSRYTNDKMITDHYAIIPTGQGTGSLKSLKGQALSIYLLIVRRFLSVFYPPAVYKKLNITARIRTESFFASAKVLEEAGYLEVASIDIFSGKLKEDKEEESESSGDLKAFDSIKKGSKLAVEDYKIKEGETSPPRRYNSGSLILAMENAGQLIEDEELRSQIKGSGIGTSATRAEILKKLFGIKYLSLSKKTQIVTPTQLGEMIYDVVDSSLRSMLNPELTASWEKGLAYVAQGDIGSEEYMEKLQKYIRDRVENVKALGNTIRLREKYDKVARYYKK